MVSVYPTYAALTSEERRELPKMGAKTISFVEKAYDFTRQNPNLVPPYLDLAAFGVDFNAVRSLWTVHSLSGLGT
jgi:hypothetical protein